MPESSTIFPVKQFGTRHQKSFPTRRLRDWIDRRYENGLADSGALIKVGGRLFIDEAAFFAWVRSHRVRRPAPPDEIVATA